MILIILKYALAAIALIMALIILAFMLYLLWAAIEAILNDSKERKFRRRTK